MMGNVYPEIDEKAEHVSKVIRSEEESFGRTLDTGLEIFDGLVRKIKSSAGKVVPGVEVFRLYDTYGFPVDLTEVMAEEQGLALDMSGFDRMMKQQQEKSRGAAHFEEGRKEQLQYMLGEVLSGVPQERLKTEFVRGKFELQAGVIEIFEMSDGSSDLLAIIPERTPFYVEAGGQTGDHGYIECELFKARVDYLLKYGEAIVHFGQLTEKNYTDIETVGDLKIHLALDPERRRDIMRNHTATHLLHSALRQVLGEHVRQSGSYVGPDKLRFDFSHFKPMTQGEIEEVERIVNSKILDGSAVATVVDDLEKAKKSGAMAIFGEKYKSKVRVVSIGDFSRELCGGTHVENISQIGLFMITLETAVASGVRRIEAVTGREALATMLKQKETVARIGKTANKPTEELVAAVEETYRKILELQKENRKLKAEKFSGGVSIGEEVKVGDFRLRCHDFGKVESEEMAGWIDSGQGVTYPLISVAVGMVNSKRTYMASASGTAKVHVGNLSKEVLQKFGGRGGGKRNFAQGSIPSGVESKDIFEVFKGKLVQLDKKG